ncbi:unnamed protein product [Staurois parvus]|uniref:Uncharacterized protein n=1 Tax=Staurois parvus TaxID=386267 RepID=A0ABN9AAR4_9NEOB|nr:unnamed protein product [Staurois parvus]
MSARSCDQLCPITADHIPSSATYQCQLSVLIHATCQFPSVPTSAHQCHISVPI